MHKPTVNESFWRAPPWQGGVRRQRLGLHRLAVWQAAALRPAVMENKRLQMRQRYSEVVASTAGSEPVQALLHLMPLARPLTRRHPDLIADVALCVVEDLCLIDIEDQMRLVAGCVCAPSYWRLQDKIGRPLAAVHGPVPGMQRLMPSITRFMQKMPQGQPFQRANWFLHGDAGLFHQSTELDLDESVQSWSVRSERQTLVKLNHRYLLFAIEVRCEPLAHLANFPDACRDMLRTLAHMPEAEIDYFGGVEKYQRIIEYVRSLLGDVDD